MLNGLKLVLIMGLILSISGCGRVGRIFGGQDEPAPTTTAGQESAQTSRPQGTVNNEEVFAENRREQGNELFTDPDERETLFDLFGSGDDPNVTLGVNRFIWSATLDILDFLPIQSADPFSGIIVYGFGTPPGGRTAYRATVYIQDPALDARSLRVALASRSGAAPVETVRAVEDAILTRARQLRIAAGEL